MTDFTGIPLTQPPGVPTHGAPHPQAPQGTVQERHAAQEFESVFLTEMLQPMFEGLSTDGLGGGGQGEEMFRPMLIQQYADFITKQGGVGIAANILAELHRMNARAGESAADAVAHAPPTLIPPTPTSMAALDLDTGSTNGANR